MKDSDSALGQFTRAAGWNAAGYRFYLLLQQGEGEFIDPMIIALELPYSEDEIDPDERPLIWASCRLRDSGAHLADSVIPLLGPPVLR